MEGPKIKYTIKHPVKKNRIRFPTQCEKKIKWKGKKVRKKADTNQKRTDFQKDIHLIASNVDEAISKIKEFDIQQKTNQGLWVAKKVNIQTLFIPPMVI